MEVLALVVGGAGVLVTMALAVAASRLGAAHRPRDPPPNAALVRERLRAAVEEAAGGKLSRVEPYADLTDNQVESGLRFIVSGVDPKISVRRTRDTRSGGIGDEELDGLVEISGPRDHVLALCDVACRTALRNLLRGSVRVTGFRVEQGELTVQVPTAGFAHGHPGLSTAAQAIGALATHFETPRDVVPLLAGNVERDPQPGVRLNNLDALIAGHPADPRTRDTLRKAFQDADARLRLRAALAAGGEGHPVLEDLALHPGVEDAHAAQAVEGLGNALPLGRIEPLARAAALQGRAGRPATTLALIAALGRHPDEYAFRWLEFLARTADDAFGPEVVEALTARPRTEAERVLIAVLETSNTDRRRFVESAARQLGLVGTAQAVLPLKDAAARHGRAVASLARQSIARIQSRLDGTPGELSLTGEQGGRVSLSDDASGRLWLPAKPPERDC